MGSPRKKPSQQVTGTTVKAAERRRQALDMRKLGYTYQQIADRYYNGNRGWAYRDMGKAFREITAEAADEVRLLELERLDVALTKVMPKVLTGDDKAVRSMLHIMERRAKYLGLDTPVQLEQLGNGTVNVIFDPALQSTGMAEPELTVDGE